MNPPGATADDLLQQAIAAPFRHSVPSHIGVAVSGGSDSMALLSLVSDWAMAQDIPCSAVTVDHGLRAEAAREAEMVAEFCAAHHIPHDILHWQGWDGGGNLQAMARNARYGLIAEWAAAKGVETIVLGHTQDDQAETFLMRLSRQSGVDGLAKMRGRFLRGGVEWLRPLLAQPRAQLRAYLDRRGVGWIEDPSNEDPSFERVRARDILKQLAPLEITSETLSNVSTAMGEARAALEHYTWREAQSTTSQDHGDLLIAGMGSSGIPPEIERRILTNALQWVGNSDYPPRSSALSELEASLQTAPRHTLAGCVILKEHGNLRITREFNAVRDLTCSTETVWDDRWRLDGPHESGLEIRALGEAGLRDCADWRIVGIPRMSLLASPSVWRGNTLVSAPLAGFENGWQAGLKEDFVTHLRNK